MTEYTLTYDEMAGLLAYTVHLPDCEAVVFRAEQHIYCTCGYLNAVRPLHQFEAHLPATERLLPNRDLFGGRSVPAWLRALVPVRYRRIEHRHAHQPGLMSDG